jgi:hypothetical protein
VSVFLPLDGLSLRARLLILLLAREAELSVDQVDSARARALVRRGLANGARVAAPCYPARRRTDAYRPWMCQSRAAA